MKPICFVLPLAIVSPLVFAQPGPYTVSAFPSPTGGSSSAFHMSQTGVAGFIYDAQGNQSYVVWTPEGIEEYLPFDAFTSIGLSSSNNNGVVVGGGFGFRQPPQAIAWTDGVGAALPSEDNDGDETEYLFGSSARAVNDAGVVVGFGETEYGSNGVVWHTDGDVELLHSINPDGPDYAAAKDINSAGVVAGISVVGSIRHAVTWTNGVATDLGIFAGGTLSSANAINELGQVVGWGVTGDDSGVAFISDGTTDSITALPNIAGMAYGEAFDVNDSGWAVGACIPSGAEGHGVATLWVDGVGYDLNELIPEGSGWELVSANGITNEGVIVGDGLYNGDQRLAFRLTPAPACRADITGDGALDFFDVAAFIEMFGDQTPEADFNADGVWNFFDVSLFISDFSAGCP